MKKKAIPLLSTFVEFELNFAQVRRSLFSFIKWKVCNRKLLLYYPSTFLRYWIRDICVEIKFVIITQSGFFMYAIEQVQHELNAFILLFLLLLLLLLMMLCASMRLHNFREKWKIVYRLCVFEQQLVRAIQKLHRFNCIYVFHAVITLIMWRLSLRRALKMGLWQFLWCYF